MSGHSHAVVTAPHCGNPVLKTIGWISRVCGWIAATMIVMAVLITCQMIFVRFVLNVSTIWQTETVVYLMIGATMIGLPYVQYLRGHVNVDLLPLLLPMWARKVLVLMTFGLSIAVVCAMLYHGYHWWYEVWDWGESSGTVWDPKLWVPYLALPIGFALYLLQLAADLWGQLTGVEQPFGLAEGGLADQPIAAASGETPERAAERQD